MKNRSTKIKSVIGLVGLLAIIFYLLPTFSSSTTRIPYTDTKSVSQGREIYFNECASCHGKTLQGDANWKQRDVDGYLPAPPHNETGHTWHHDDQLLFRLTKEGIQSITGPDYKSHMPAFATKLSDEQIWSVLAYIKSQWPADLARRHTESFKDK